MTMSKIAHQTLQVDAIGDYLDTGDQILEVCAEVSKGSTLPFQNSLQVRPSITTSMGCLNPSNRRNQNTLIKSEEKTPATTRQPQSATNMTRRTGRSASPGNENDTKEETETLTPNRRTKKACKTNQMHQPLYAREWGFSESHNNKQQWTSHTSLFESRD